MDKIGLTLKISDAAISIDLGRKGFATKRKAEEGRIFYFFDDAFLALEVIKDKTLYQCAEKIIPHESKYRVKSFPMDSYHIACEKHQARLQNILKAPGIDPIEKALLRQHLANMSTAQTAYVELQKQIIGNR